MKKNRQRSTLPLLGLLFLALFFLIGVILGQVLAAQLPTSIGIELDRYLRHFLVLEELISTQTVFASLALYLRYPLLAFLLGFTAVGVLLLPCTAAAFGFFLSFSVSCFTVAFGNDGILVALAVSGIRCGITLPCFLALGASSWKTSAGLANLSFGKGRRLTPVMYGRVCWVRFAVCTAALVLGMCVDLFVSPWLLRLALEYVLA